MVPHCLQNITELISLAFLTCCRLDQSISPTHSSLIFSSSLLETKGKLFNVPRHALHFPVVTVCFLPGMPSPPHLNTSKSLYLWKPSSNATSLLQQQYFFPWSTLAVLLMLLFSPVTLVIETHIFLSFKKPEADFWQNSWHAASYTQEP